MAITPIIRVFISSTFSDFALERNALQNHVFPALRTYCQTHGARFQAIDLRWGISEAASQEQRTIAICHEEIRRCQELSPFFSFVALLGDRYGSLLVPEFIPAPDFVALMQVLTAPQRTFLETWYALDLNALPPGYVLQSRAIHAQPETWVAVQNQLLEVLDWAQARCDVTPVTRFAIQASITEQEIAAGIFHAAPATHALCFMRTIASRPAAVATPQFFEQDPARKARLQDLKHQLAAQLPDAIIPFAARWHRDGVTDEHIPAFCQLVQQRMQAKIDAALAASAREHVHERVQRRFVAPRLDYFTGRAETLAALHAYVQQPATKALLVSGESGVGKTTVLLKFALEAHQRYPHAVLLRLFIGGDTAINDTPTLLAALDDELRRAYAPQDYDVTADATTQFAALITAATEQRPLIVIIDALDQLRDERPPLSWIPRYLPPHVHLVIATLPGQLLERLQGYLADAQLITIAPLAQNDGERLLDDWMRSVNRRLQPLQRTAILQRFAQHRLPLFLRLLFEEARHWHSYDAPPSDLPSTSFAAINRFFARLEQPAQHGYPLVALALGLLASARYGLGEDELLDVLALDQRRLQSFVPPAPTSPDITRLPMVLWARLYADLEPYLAERQADDTLLLACYHRQMEDVIAARYLQQDRQILPDHTADEILKQVYHSAESHGGQPTDTARDEIARSYADSDSYRRRPADADIARHRELAAYFAAQPLFGQTGLVNRRKLSELPYLFVQGALFPHLHSLFRDLAFLREKIRYQKTESVLADFRSLFEHSAYDRVLNALRASARIVNAYPDQLTDELHIRLAGSAATPDGLVIAASFLQPGLQLRESQSLPVPRFAVTHVDSTFELCIGTFTGHSTAVTACAANADGSKIIAGAQAGAVRVWDAVTGEAIILFDDHQAEIMSCALSPDGLLALSASADGDLYLWETETGRQRAHFTGTSPVCAFSPDGTSFLHAGSTWSIRDVMSANQIQTLGDLFGSMRAARFTQDGKQVVCAAYSYMGIAIWACDVATGKVVHHVRQRMTVTSCAFAVDGDVVMIGDDKGDVKTWNFIDDADAQHVENMNYTLRGLVSGCTLSDDGAWSAGVSSDDGIAHLWVASHLEYFYRHPCKLRSCTFVANTPQNMLLVGGENGILWLWRTTLNGEMQQRIHSDTLHYDAINVCAFSDDGRHALSSAGNDFMRRYSHDEKLLVWEVASGNVIANYPLNGWPGASQETFLAWDKPYQAAFTANWWNVLVTNRSSEVGVFDIVQKSVLRQFRALDPRAQIIGCAYSPDKRLVVGWGRDTSAGISAGYDSVYVWDNASTQVVFQYHRRKIQACCFAADSHTLTIAWYGRQEDELAVFKRAESFFIETYDTTTWTTTTGSEPAIGDVFIEQVALSPASHCALYAYQRHDRDQSNMICIWDFATHRSVAEFPFPSFLTAIQHGFSVGMNDCCWSPDGRVVIGAFGFASGLGLLCAWDALGHTLAEWWHDAPLRCCAFHPDGKQVMVGDQQSGVYFLTLENRAPVVASAPAPAIAATPRKRWRLW